MKIKDCSGECVEALARYTHNESIRNKRSEANKDGRWREVDEAGRIAQRMMTLGMPELVAEAITDPDFNLLERIINDSELMPVAFVLSGSTKTRSVGRISVRSSAGRGYGTGFMVSPELLLTNHHVLGDTDTAARSFVQFDYYDKSPGDRASPQTFQFQPERFFISNRPLDFALVAVEAVNADGLNVESRGWNPLITESGKAIVGDNVNIVQHPSGRPMEVSLRNNKIIDVLDDFLHYETDTEPGSSGSPVYNDQWQVAALHHAGVPEVDDNGNVVKWVANEGVRISRIMAHLNTVIAAYGDPVRQLYARLSLIPPDTSETINTAADNAVVASNITLNNAAGNQLSHQHGEPKMSTDGSVEWTIPVNLSISIGAISNTFSNITPSIDKTRSPQSLPRPGDVISEKADQLLANFKDRIYYDQESDQSNCDSYYAGVDDNAGKIAHFKQLSELLKSSHTTSHRYRTAKNKFLYPWVDLHRTEDCQQALRSIYSGQAFSAHELLMQDLLLEQQLIGEEYASMSDQEIELELERKESSKPFNCEHVVPQSWFSKLEPMKGDLHHLFACESGCNSFRGNAPYFEFPEEALRENCGRIEGPRNKRKFEPTQGKGPAARATLYFLLRYPGFIGDSERELQTSRLKMLINWHQASPPDVYEHHRNAAIFEIQGNRNPLIDHPDWADQISFRMGFG